MNMQNEYTLRLRKHIELAKRMVDLYPDVEKAVTLVVETFREGKKILLAGNGGSAADAQHWAAEWVIRLSHNLERPGLPAMSLSTDTSIITAGGNDIGYENIFARQVEAYGTEGDLLILISTSGNSENLVLAATRAREMKVAVLGILGNDGGKLGEACDQKIIIPSDDTQRIQEMQEFVGHILCELSEKALYEKE